MTTITIDEVRGILAKSTGNEKRIDSLKDSSQILGHVPEMDSLAIVITLQMLEERYLIKIEDDEVEPEIFESLLSIKQFIESKLAQNKSNLA